MLSQEISNHLDSENKDLLVGMQSNYDLGSQALKGVMSKLEGVLNTGSASRTLCYLVAIILAFFFVLYIIR